MNFVRLTSSNQKNITNGLQPAEWHGRGVTFLTVLMENNDSQRRENHSDSQKCTTYIVQSNASSASICATLNRKSFAFTGTTLEAMEVNVHL